MQNTELVSAEPSCFPAENPLPGHPAMVVCPGGAYATLSPFEGEAVARYFASKGFTGYVCNYGVGEQARMPGPLHQLARTVQAAREKADFVAVCGFSAGAHLCALLSTRWKSVAAELAVSGAALRPDAAVLGYPLTDFLMSMPLQPLAMFQAVDGTT
ncbi:MAG TPA: alpha/beta hydrolase, partial [Candidatus Limiplasma sp.]|nr:alpha/beta hydrolase [Candidatus Limiplasma sp.]